ncbi:hypothetical protein IGI04_035589 [Brassica rapa subsp. trilocularis]|uniref:Uncharacterized protein n=1 Tax=Brassica rapa subsp. trilocularis TaxID=1813537 RepID=A0ABQ7LEZ0_BRACM|nr:hypothetical protein IGI04_035589 [Brassica rapa subsp. trilocularis]
MMNLENGVTKDVFIRTNTVGYKIDESALVRGALIAPILWALSPKGRLTGLKYSRVEPTSLAAKPTKLDRPCRARACYVMGLVEGCNPSPTISPPPVHLRDMASGNRLSREEKGKDIATSPSPARDADGGPLEDFDIIHRDALRDTENMSLSQRLLVADAHRQFREEIEENVEGKDREASGSEAPSLVVRPRRRARRRGRIDQSDRLPAPRSVPFYKVDCRPVIYHPGGIFEELPSLPPEAWPDLSREWIRRQQARIARVDWESRLPCVLGPRKSRLSLFTRKQQKLLNQARKMEGVPDLSAMLKGKLQMLSTKSSSAGASEVRPVPTDGDVNSEPPAQSSPKRKANKAKAKNRSVPLEEAPSSADVSEVAAKKKKKKESKKRSREETSVGAMETSTAAGNDGAERNDPADSTRGSPEERPKKKLKKKTAEDDGTSAPEIPSRSGEPATEVGDGSRDESPSSKGAPSSSARETGAGSGGSLPWKAGGGIRFLDRVEFLYDEATPLVLNPLRCAELTRQIRGGTKELPPVDDLYFKKEYIDAAMAGRRSDGSMNYLVEKYDSTLKQTMIQLGASDKLARTRLGVIERLRAENKKASDKAAKEKEELEDKLKSDRLAKKDALREKTRLERLVASLEKEKAELEGERDAVVGTLVKERQRLRDSRVQEVTRERIKVQTAMADKSTRCIGKMKGYLDRLIAREKAKNLYGQASGTKKCLEMIKDSGIAIPPSMINIFSEQEKMYEAEVANLYLEPFSEDDYALSPLNLPSRFVNEELMGVLDPYGSNVGLIGHESASQLITFREATEDPVDEPMVDITSALSERIVVPEGTTIEERPDGSDPEETGDAIQTDTGDVAAEDPVLVSSSEERGEDEVGEEENRSSPALVEEMVPNLPVSNPPAQVEGLGDQVVEEETIEALDPSRDDQDVVTSDEPVIGFTRLSSCFDLELSKSR